ncbi:MAG: energy transducer TonB [Dysgonamonadaceae bacterium]|jgi:TonB family protein|nr:energy transducer TonB [Dysgonamonadaceae bacterium]
MKKIGVTATAAYLFIAGFLLLQAFVSSSASAQKKKDTAATGGKVIENPDIDPFFTGGSGEMNRFISRSLKYPPEAAKNDKQGLVVYNFIVEKDGTLTNFELMHRADSLLNEEALRIIKSMPPWQPAKYKGEIVRARAYVPMYFKLNKNAKAQRSTYQAAIAKTDVQFIENNEIYTIVDQMPQYPAGEAALAGFISEKIAYPRDALQEGIQGSILCSFIVAQDGRISNIEVVKGLYPSLDNEAIRVLSVMPRWTPGTNNGEKVNVKCLLPINFTIDEDPIPPVSPKED